MRKLLLGATALTAAAAVQTANAAEIADGLTLSGSVAMYALLSGEHEVKSGGTTTTSDGKMGFKDWTSPVSLVYTTQTDDGYNLTVYTEIPGSADGKAAANADESSVTVAKGGLSFMFGRDDGAIPAIVTYPESAGSGLVDGNLPKLMGDVTDASLVLPGVRLANSGDAAKVMAIYSTGPVTAGVSYAPTSGEVNVNGQGSDDDAKGDGFIEAAAKFEQNMSGLDVAVTAAMTSATGGKGTNATTGASEEYDDYGGFSVGGSVSTMGLTASAAYIMNGEGGYVKNTVDGDTTMWVSAGYTLPGAMMGNDVGLAAQYAMNTIEYKTTGAKDKESSAMAFGVDTTIVAGIGASLEYISYTTEQGSDETTGSSLALILSAGF